MFNAKEKYLYYNEEIVCGPVHDHRNMEVDESRLEGESWLAMRERVKPMLDMRDDLDFKFAERIASALNNEVAG